MTLYKLTPLYKLPIGDKRAAFGQLVGSITGSMAGSITGSMAGSLHRTLE